MRERRATDMDTTYRLPVGVGDAGHGDAFFVVAEHHESPAVVVVVDVVDTGLDTHCESCKCEVCCSRSVVRVDAETHR